MPPLPWILPICCLGAGPVISGAVPLESLRILPPKVEGLASGLSEYFSSALRKGLRDWEIHPKGGATGLRLITTLRKSADAHLLLEASLFAGAGEIPVLKKVYAAPLTRLDRMVVRLLDDLALQLNGRAIPAARKLLMVKEFGQGISDIVLTDASGTHAVRLTRHGSRTQAPTAARKGRFAYITYVAGPPQIWGMDLKQGHAQRLYTPPKGSGAVSGLTLSPDGQTLAFLESDKRGWQTIRLLTWGTGIVRDLTHAMLDIGTLAWSPDGGKLAFVQGQGGLEHLVILSRDGHLEKKYSFPDGAIREPAWSPDGGSIAFVTTAKSGVHELRNLDLASGNSKVLFSNATPLSSPRWCPQTPWMTFTSRGREICLLNTESGASHSLFGRDVPCHTPRWVW